jgi:hypothetical protein
VKLLASIDDLEYLKREGGLKHLQSFQHLNSQTINKSVEEYGRLSQIDTEKNRYGGHNVYNKVVKSGKDSGIYKSRMFCSAIFFNVLEMGEHIQHLHHNTYDYLDKTLFRASKDRLGLSLLKNMRNGLAHTLDLIMESSKKDLIIIVENIEALKEAIFDVIYVKHNELSKNHDEYKPNSKVDRTIDNGVYKSTKREFEEKKLAYTKENLRYVAKAISDNNNKLDAVIDDKGKGLGVNVKTKLKKEFKDKLQEEYISKIPIKETVVEASSDDDWYD